MGLWDEPEKGLVHSVLFETLSRCFPNQKSLQDAGGPDQTTISRWKNLKIRPRRFEYLRLLTELLHVDYDTVDVMLSLAGLELMRGNEVEDHFGRSATYPSKTPEELQREAINLVVREVHKGNLRPVGEQRIELGAFLEKEGAEVPQALLVPQVRSGRHFPSRRASREDWGFQVSSQVSATITDVRAHRKHFISSLFWGHAESNDSDERLQHFKVEVASEAEECRSALSDAELELPNFARYGSQTERYSLRAEEYTAVIAVILDVPGLVISNRGSETEWIRAFKTVGQLEDPRWTEVAGSAQKWSSDPMVLEYEVDVDHESSQPIEVEPEHSIRLPLSVVLRRVDPSGWRPLHQWGYYYLEWDQALLEYVNGDIAGLQLEVDPLVRAKERFTFGLRINEGQHRLQISRVNVHRFLSNWEVIQTVGNDILERRALDEWARQKPAE